VPNCVTTLGNIFDFIYRFLATLAVVVTVISTVHVAGLWAAETDAPDKRRLAGWYVSSAPLREIL